MKNEIERIGDVVKKINPALVQKQSKRWEAAEKKYRYRKVTDHEKKYAQKLKKEIEISKVQVTTKELVEMVKVKGQELLNETFTKTRKKLVLDKENLGFVQTICAYFADDEKFLKSKIFLNTPSFDKGLLIIGTNGFGKSFLFEVLNSIFAPVANCTDKYFSITNVDELVNQYNQHGSSALDPFKKKGNVFFDEIGIEEVGKHYGSQKDVVSELFQLRIGAMKRGKVSHGATNLTMDAILQKYGKRVESRFYELFNIVEISSNRDFRKI